MIIPRRNRNKYLTGFSLVEMLIVVSIMGILSAVISASLYSARPKARLGVVQTQFNSLHPYLVTCMNDGDVIDFTVDIPIAGAKICGHANEDSIFPELPGHWIYVNASGLSKFKATSDEGDLWSVECGETGCITTTPTPSP